MKNWVAENTGNKREYWYQVLFKFQVICSLQELFIYAKIINSHQPLLHKPTRSLISQYHYPPDPMIARSPKYRFCNCSLISTQPSIKRLITYYDIGDVQGSKLWHGYNSISTHQSLALHIWFWSFCYFLITFGLVRDFPRILRTEDSGSACNEVTNHTEKNG